MSIAFVFPGQGSQQVGMGRDLAESSAAAREVFDEVDEALGQKLSSLMWEGPEDHLTLTENAQPALMAVSLAVVRALMAKGDEWVEQHEMASLRAAHHRDLARGDACMDAEPTTSQRMAGKLTHVSSHRCGAQCRQGTASASEE